MIIFIDEGKKHLGLEPNKLRLLDAKNAEQETERTLGLVGTLKLTTIPSKLFKNLALVGIDALA
jgi:hypothetical protein